MYPLLRFLGGMAQARRMPHLPVLGTHVSHHRCWPWDLDPWIELNNGRTLTLYDLGRIPMAQRSGLIDVLRREGWGITVAGNSVRYRRRIKAFERFGMLSRVIGWDERFFYMEQSLWKGAECANHMLLRSAVTSGAGIVAPARVVERMDHAQESPALPPWVQAWIMADATRPWPPEVPGDVGAGWTVPTARG